MLPPARGLGTVARSIDTIQMWRYRSQASAQYGRVLHSGLDEDDRDDNILHA